MVWLPAEGLSKLLPLTLTLSPLQVQGNGERGRAAAKTKALGSLISDPSAPPLRLLDSFRAAAGGLIARGVIGVFGKVWVWSSKLV